MLGGDLADTARRALAGGAAALAEVRLEVLRPVQPMLAATAALGGRRADGDGAASVEWKLDGARIQVHRDGDDVRVFTRNLNDVTERLPEVVEVVRSFPARTFVLDGEAIGLADDALPRRFQDTMSRFGRDDATSHALTLAAFFFDVLHLDGDDLLDRPLAERSAILTALVGPWRVPAIETDDADVGRGVPRRRARDRPRGRDGEGARLALRGRSPGRVVAQGEAGAHARPRRARGRVGTRPAAGLARTCTSARDPESGEFVMVGKTFKGLTDELLTWQTERLQEIVTPARRPRRLRAARSSSSRSRSTACRRRRATPGGVALRFARVRVPARQVGGRRRHDRRRPRAAGAVKAPRAYAS